MIKKKICLIGGFAVGKSSLVRRYVSGIFSDNYYTTVGVKIDQRPERVDGKETLLMIWDLAGRDDFQAVQQSYLRGSSGFLYVMDGTRKETLEDLNKEMSKIGNEYSDAASILLVNKYDLIDDWEITEEHLQPFKDRGVTVFFTSAKTGDNVEKAFRQLALEMCETGESGAMGSTRD